MNHPEISGTLEQFKFKLSLGCHEEGSVVKDSHLGDKKYHYVCFSEHLARGSAVFLQDPVRNSAWRNRSGRGLPVSASSPHLFLLAGTRGSWRHTHREHPDWASPSGLMSLTHTGHRAPLPKSAVLLWSEQLFLDTLKSFIFPPEK